MHRQSTESVTLIYSTTHYHKGVNVNQLNGISKAWYSKG